MKRSRWLALLLALVFVAAACGGGDRDDDGAGPTTTAGTDSGPTTTGLPGETTTTGAPDPCEGVTLEETEKGITADTITLAVIADTGSPLAPGLFQGSVDALNGWAKWRNETQGGLACRTVEVKAYDSKLSANDSKNAFTAACDEAVATVGTTALFVNNIDPMTGCKDKAGATTGLPDIPVLMTEPIHQCSPVSYPVIAPTGECPFTSGVRTFRERVGAYNWYLDQFTDLHGVWVVPSDLPSTISSSMPGFRATQELGIELDAEFGASGTTPQEQYAPIVAAIESNGSTYARSGLDYAGTVKLRKEAAVQGVDTVEVWDCSLQCYTQKLIDEGGADVENQYVWMQFVPFEEADTNETLAAFIEYTGEDKVDGFGAQAWTTAMAVGKVVDGIVAADGPNAVTRAAIFDGLKALTDFDAGGMIGPTNVAERQPSGCFVMLQVRNGEFVRVFPEERGTLSCATDDSDLYEITLDAATAFKG